MSRFIIVTDSNTDFPQGHAQQLGVLMLNLSYTLNGVSYAAGDSAMPVEQFYEAMRSGSVPKTSAVNGQDARSLFTNLAQQDTDALCIAFSGILSATYQNMKTAADEVMEKFPGRKFVVIDSKSASMGEGLLVQYAWEYAQNHNLEETASYTTSIIQHIRHTFTVEDLKYLFRGGRVSRASAIIGTALNIKPVLYVCPQGRLLPFDKVRGRKASLVAMAQDMEENFDRTKCDRFFVSHGDCLEDVRFLVEEVKKRTGIKNHMISYVGAAIGSHSGPGTVALFYYGKPRPQPKNSI